ncbi:rRNA-binding ribosome biosynthesis protein utp25, partial [Ascosphaera atra]
MAVRGRGRGGFSRGRGGRGRGGRRPMFESSRVDEINSSDEANARPEGIPDAESNDEEDLDASSSSSEDEDDDRKEKPYNALLNLFHVGESNAPARKRRKIQHKEAETERATRGESPPAEAAEEEDKEDQQEQDDVLEQRDASDDEDNNEAQEVDDDHEGDDLDPFERHISNHDESLLARKVDAISKAGWKTEKSLLPDDMRSVTAFPDIEDAPRPSLPNASRPKDLMLKKKLIEPAQKHISNFDSHIKPV